MVERTRTLDIVSQVILALGLIAALAPLALVAIAATHDLRTVNQVPMPLIPGHDFWTNVSEAWARAHLGQRLWTSFLFATGVAAGKVIFSALSAFSLVYFRYRGRVVIFWLIFITLMLPLEARIVPTYAVAANLLRPYQTILDLTGISWLINAVTSIDIHVEWNLLNSQPGLILPFVATATGTFLYRQFFLTLPDELAEAARMDGAGALRFFWDVVVPLSRTNMVALATIMFVWAWNTYLWPLLVTTDPSYRDAAVALGELIPQGFAIPDWNVAMAGTLVIMAPPLVLIILTQRWFVRGLVATEK